MEIVNSLIGDHPWCKTEWTLTGGSPLRGKINKINPNLTDSRVDMG